MQHLVEEIKNKKELKALSDDFVGSIAKELLEKRKVNLEKKSERKKFIKEVRSILHDVHGVFKKSKYAKKSKLLNELKDLDDLETHDKILGLHRSTKERLPYYSIVYKGIFSITGKPKAILDLGCGLNPVSLPYMGLKDVTYYASELTEEDTKFVQDYFDKVKTKAHTFQMDLTRIDKLPAADVCFMFKLLDSLEALKWNITKTILERTNAKWLVVSFPLKTLGGKKPISRKRLSWFERAIEGHKYETFEIPNEIFYIIKFKQ